MNGRLSGILGFLIVMAAVMQAATTDPSPGFRLTVELREGSRVNGISKDKTFDFRSEILGALTVPLQKIRSLDAATKTNLVKLTTTSDDTLLVAFAMKKIRVATLYGEVQLPVTLIKSVRVSGSGQTGRPLDGLIGLWSGEGNAVDTVAGNNGSLRHVRFTDGVVRQAFSFAPDQFPYGTYTGVQISDRPAYVLTKALTIEGWIRPRGNGYMIFFRGDHRPGLDPYSLSLDGQMNLTFGVCAEDGASASVKTPVGLGAWIHVAGVLDDSSGTLSLYTNGVLAAQVETHIHPMGELIPEMTPGIGIGNVNDGGNNFPFNGEIDEIGLYNRALSADEIHALYDEHSADARARAEPLPPRNPMRRPLRFPATGFNSD